MIQRLALVFAAALALAACSEGPVNVADTPDAARKYIVVFHQDAFPAPRLSASQAITDYARGHGAAPRFVYTSVLRGFAAELTDAQLAALRVDPRVAYVEEDAPAQIFTTQLFPTWGIDRIDEPDLPLSNTFTYTATGAGVRAYVLDTGVRRTHQQLGNRVAYIANGANGDFVGDGHGSAEDCHGHGTHVAGTIGGSGYGVAKGVLIRAGRVVDCQGNGNASMAIAAMDWVRLNGIKPAVVNMSLGYGDVQAARDAAASLVSAGYYVVAAAGNGDFAGNPQNACLQSPGGAPSVMTVGATTSSDHESSFSNFGSCVDILAPGSSISSALHTSDTAAGLKSGTSMAAPHVAGVAALYLEGNTLAAPWLVTAVLKSNATSNTITLNTVSALTGTPNLFLFTSF